MILLQADTVADLLDCSTETVELEARQGRLPGLKFGRAWVFPGPALESVLCRRAVDEMHARVSAKQNDEHPASAARAAVVPVPGQAFGPLRAVPPALPVAPERA